MFPIVAAAPAFGIAAKILGVVTVVSVIFGAGLYVGNEWGGRDLLTAKIDQYEEEQIIEEKRDKVTGLADKHYLFALGKEKKKQETLIIRVPEYAKSDCMLPNDVGLLHDFATEGTIPPPK